MRSRSTLSHRAFILAATIICAAQLAPSVQAQFVWSKRIANSTTLVDDAANIGLTLDTNRNCYVTAWFDGTNDFGGIILTNQSAGGSDIFVAKYNSTGTLQWVQRAGGTGLNAGRGVGVDTNGNIYVTGGYYGPANFGSTNLPASFNQGFFLAKYNNSGVVQWVQSGVSADYDVWGTGMALDAAGNSYALVDISSGGTTVTLGSTNIPVSGAYGESMILAKYDNTGALRWAQLMGGDYGNTYSASVAVDTAGNVYVRGHFDYALTIGPTNLTVNAGSDNDLFVVKFNNSGTLVWVQHPNGQIENSGGIAVDQAENVYAAGAFDNTLSFSGSVNLTNIGVYSGFIAKYNSSGAIQWAAQAGGGTNAGLSGAGFYYNVALDSHTNVYAVGGLSPIRSVVAAVGQYNPTGTLQWTYTASGTPAYQFSSLVSAGAVDSTGNCYLGGLYQGSTTFGTNVLQAQEKYDFFLAAVTVTNPTIQFTASPTTGVLPLTVQFDSPNVDGSGNPITSWNWSFGDGATSTAQNPSHTYTAVGTFAPGLVATNNHGVAVIGFGPQVGTSVSTNNGLVLNGSFETGDFTDWTLSGTDPGDAIVDDGSTSGIEPISGNYLAALQSVGGLSYLSQTLPTTPGATYLLSLWLDSPDGATPNEFLVSWNGTTLFDEQNIPALGWTNLQFMVSATGYSTVLEFGFRNDISYLGLDDVEIVLVSNPSPSALTTLYQFGANLTNGIEPQAGLVQGSDGNFYGTTPGGGTSGWGTVFKITSQGTLTTLWQFNGTNGQEPRAGLVQGSDGNFYGTTFFGGLTNLNSGVGFGTVFKITSQGTLTTLYQFGNQPTDGQYPYAGLVQGSDGNFYSTTDGGGTNKDGTVFKITSQGTLTTLWQFNGTNGLNPTAGLVQGSDGNFYGTTGSGGTNFIVTYLGTDYLGTVFKITSQGTLTTLWQFNGANGANSDAGLVQGSDGNFYGTTQMGGLTNLNYGYGDGTAFKITPQGTLSTLWQFGTQPTNGVALWAGLVQGSDGNFYGTTAQGGSANCSEGCGTVFKITSQGTLTTLWQFNGTNGQSPMAGLVQGSDGFFYGTTQWGGTNNYGTVFRLYVPLSPPANQISAIRLAATNVVFTVPSVAGETYQLQYRSSLTSGNWSNIPGVSVTNSIGATLTLTNFGAASKPQGFYRFAITP